MRAGIGLEGDPKSARVTQKLHEEILDAVRAHDADAAEEVMLEHLAESEKRLRRWLQTRRGKEQSRSPVALTRTTEKRRITRRKAMTIGR